MRKTLMASIVISLLASPAGAGGITRSWPKIDNWMTVMLDGGPRGPMCSIVARTTSDTLLNIIMADGLTHLYLTYGKQATALPRTLNLLADGRQFFAAPILGESTDPMGNRSVVADLPGSTYRDVVLPALMHSNFMQVDFNNRRFIVETQHFAQVVPQIIDCALATQHTVATQ